MTSQYRVRFVNSPYNKRRSRNDTSGNIQAAASEDCGAGSLAKPRNSKETTGTEHSYDTQWFDNRFDPTAINPQSPVSPLSPASSHRETPLEHGQARQSTEAVESATCPPIQEDTDHMPVFFDLSMNFDLLGEEWLSFPPPPPDPPEADIAGGQGDNTPRSNLQETSVVIGLEDNRLIQHYLNVMTQYTKIRSSGDDNIYTHIFSNLALFYVPLFNVLMAWTALHLGQTRGEPELIESAEHRYSSAVSLLHQDQEVAHHFELSLVTIWFALQFELLAARSVNCFFRHLEFAADLVEAHRRHQRAGGAAAQLGPIGSRLLIWLGSYDARAAWIGGSGRLLQNLELFCTDYDFIRAAFPDAQLATETSNLESCLRLSLEIDSLDNRIAQLNSRTVAPPAVILLAVHADLLSLQQRLESGLAVGAALPTILRPTRRLCGKVTIGLFNDLLLLASCYCLFINFHRVLPASATSRLSEKLLSADIAAMRIIRIASWTCRLRPPSPQNIWPRILFLAGAETTDLVYQEWVVKTLTDAERWGINFKKTRVLLEHVIKRQGQEGTRVDHVDAMKQSTGLFII